MLTGPQDESTAGRIVNEKILVTASGTEPATFRIVAQYFNELR